jgi:hypothetical protein
MLQMTLNLTRSSRPWTFQLLGFEVFQLRLHKKPTFRRLEEENFFVVHKKDILFFM